MKFRRDFVTNSSSSSYICALCGEEASGWDLGLDDCEMFECENGHILCKEHMLEPSKDVIINWIINNPTDYINEETCLPFKREELELIDYDELLDILFSADDFTYVAPEFLCPLCQFEEYSSKDMANYLFTKYKVPTEEVFDEVKKKNKRRKKLYDFEYVTYVANKFDLNLSDIQESWKSSYSSFREFNDSLKKWV